MQCLQVAVAAPLVNELELSCQHTQCRSVCIAPVSFAQYRARNKEGEITFLSARHDRQPTSSDLWA